ncbi:hypothetical protein NDU88_001502 [Pleurodeles waltl]|uniref:Uncharacterized protein n=1 Tax=Pleurodeles waltl TaxID=8319 RepID=A0AAV7WMM6_PLEWA|nr:hypothetical protein NDU88_001502 [Pleurodeles waltl]
MAWVGPRPAPASWQALRRAQHTRQDRGGRLKRQLLQLGPGRRMSLGPRAPGRDGGACRPNATSHITLPEVHSGKSVLRDHLETRGTEASPRDQRGEAGIRALPAP